MWYSFRTSVYLTWILKQNIVHVVTCDTVSEHQYISHVYWNKYCTWSDIWYSFRTSVYLTCGADSTMLSKWATSLTSECKHKDEPRCFSKSKVRFNIPGCCGRKMRSLQTCITYGVNTENWDSKESESVTWKTNLHSSGNSSGNITVTSADHSIVSALHKLLYYGCKWKHNSYQCWP